MITVVCTICGGIGATLLMSGIGMFIAPKASTSVILTYVVGSLILGMLMGYGVSR